MKSRAHFACRSMCFWFASSECLATRSWRWGPSRLTGCGFSTKRVVKALRIPGSIIDEVAAEELEELKPRERLYRGSRFRLPDPARFALVILWMTDWRPGRRSEQLHGLSMDSRVVLPRVRRPIIGVRFDAAFGIFSAGVAGEPERGADRLAPADAARRDDPPVERRDLFLAAARPARF